MKDRPQPEPSTRRGFSILTVLLWMILLATLAVVLHLRLRAHLGQTRDMRRQLYSFVMAENGLEYARTLLPHLEIDSLLKGLDNVHNGELASEWRNPIPYQQAVSIDPTQWQPDNDDGLPFHDGKPLLAGGYQGAGDGFFFVRFSNNPEEPPDIDHDKTVLVRSLGLVPCLPSHHWLSQFRNCVTLLETRLRKEMIFELPSPLTLFGEKANFSWVGQDFTIEGGDRPAVSLIDLSSLSSDLQGSLLPSQQDRLVGAALSPSWADLTAEYLDSTTRNQIFESQFWSDFLQQLPTFASLPGDGLTYWPEGGVLEEERSGFLVARGALTLSAGARFHGLLLHLGGGSVRIIEDAFVMGGLWLANLDPTGTNLRHLPIELHLGGNSRLIYGAEEIARALALIPPTQLQWRYLFPEMAQ